MVGAKAPFTHWFHIAPYFPQAIPAFEEAVSSMRVGGIRRVEIPGTIALTVVIQVP